jgi:tRNA threonylcarbamoyl adenosine modification protein YeaZ
MKILALEFSSGQRSVAVGDLAGATASRSLAEAVENGGRAVNAFAMIERVLRQARLEREQIECLAIGLGPGSYTGIRAAIALAQGWQLVSQPGRVRLLGLSSAECVAAQAQAEGLSGRVAVVIDAQRGEFYLASFDLSPEGIIERQPLHLASLSEVKEVERAGAIMVGPEVKNWCPEGRVIFPRAATLATLAVGRTDFKPGETLEPIYLREVSFVKAPPPRVLPA